jgi:hypothetical protein
MLTRLSPLRLPNSAIRCDALPAEGPERSKQELNRFKFQQEKLPISPMRGTAPEFAIEGPKKFSLDQSG